MKSGGRMTYLKKIKVAEKARNEAEEMKAKKDKNRPKLDFI